MSGRLETIYLDMDGVLADFDGAIEARGVSPGDAGFIHRPLDEWTAEQRHRDKQVREIMELFDFWPSIPRMHGAFGLVMAAVLTVGEENVFILTATPRVTAWRERITSQKRAWALEHLGFPSRQVITCLRAEKALRAGPRKLLVDDLPANCSEWEAAGGVAHLHTDAKSTIAKLLEFNHVVAV